LVFREYIFVIALLALMGCTSKPAVVPVAKTDDDPRCEKFYEFANKKEDMDMEGFEDAKEALAFSTGTASRILPFISKA